MNMWYLVALATHIFWPGFLENLLASCSLQQFQTKSSMNTCELKWLSLWQATAKYFQKQNLVCSPHVSIEPMIKQSLIIEVEEKSFLPSLWSDEINIKTTETVFQNSHLGGTDQKSCSFWPLRHWQKTDVNTRLLIDFF